MTALADEAENWKQRAYSVATDPAEGAASEVRVVELGASTERRALPANSVVEFGRHEPHVQARWHAGHLVTDDPWGSWNEIEVLASSRIILLPTASNRLVIRATHGRGM